MASATPLSISSSSSSSSSLSSPRSPLPLSSSSIPKSFLKPTLSLKPRAAAVNYGNGAVRVSGQSRQNGTRGAESDVMGLLLRERIVFLGFEIDDFIADALICQLLLLDARDPEKDIRLFVNSPGGSLSATMALFDVVQLVRADVSTIALGIAASTAALILGGGTKGKRLAMPSARIMIHQPLGGVQGYVGDVEVQAKEILYNKRNVTRIISEFSGRSFKQVKEDIKWDKYMSPVEGVEYGIIDGIIDRDSIIPLVPVPRAVKPRFFSADIIRDPKYLVPEIPDDEIY